MLNNSDKTPVFDQPHAKALAEAKKAFLNSFLPELIKRESCQTALDVGCGFGYFSRYLADLGLEVTAVDGRQENIIEASKRNPEVKFMVLNVEDTLSIRGIGSYDIVLCLGLLYHLENPFLAIRNLSEITKKLLIIETVITPFSSPVAVLVEEGIGQDQGLRHIAFIPSESAFLKMLYKAGFPFIYRCLTLPSHGDFHSSILYKRRRTFLIASKIEIQCPILRLVQYPKQSNQYVWYRWGLSNILENEFLRKALKEILESIGLFPRNR